MVVNGTTDEYELYRSLRLQGRSHESAADLLTPPYGEDTVAELQATYEARRLRIYELFEPAFAVGEGVGVTEYDGSTPRDVYWPQVRHRLEQKGLGGALQSISDAADRTLAFLPNPHTAERIATRGLVLGYVQSGKTTNFTALIAKAADYGYRVFVVLAGIHNSLRQQTQDRLEADVTRIAGLEARWWCPTSTSDFRTVDTNPAYFFSDPGRRALIVSKKNIAPLRKLNDWLDSTPPDLLGQVSVLVIDDEADQAGLQVGTPARRSGVHEQVIRLLNYGKERGNPRVAYVGYTATPFANLLVNPGDEEDLYPRDFVVDLPRPTGYFGAESLFGREPVDEDDEQVDGLPVIRSVPQEEVELLRPPKDTDLLESWQPRVPNTLRTAIRWFVIATAARRVITGEAQHSTMLVHTSSRVKAQCALLRPAEAVLEELRAEWRNEPNVFKSLYQGEQAKLPASAIEEMGVAFDAVAGEVEGVLDDLIIRVDNSANCTERLSYPDGEPQTVIAIGGNTLSRGLTLEGLITSYFVRTASAYDTLLQMGRWFGYRPGYGHLQRIWMTDELRSWFGDLATVEQEIRRDIARYEDDQKTPTEIAVRIRTHPQMMVTSAAKMKGAIEVMLSYGDSRIQTTRFQHDDVEWLENNHSAARRLVTESVRQGSGPEVRGGRRILRDVPHEEILRFIGRYRPHPNDYSVNLRGVLDHIELEVQASETGSRDALTWNVVVLGKQRGYCKIPMGLEKPVPAVIRRRMSLPDLDHAYIKTLMSRDDHRIDFPGLKPSGGATFRSAGEPGLIILYPIDPQTNVESEENGSGDRVPLGALGPVIGLGLSLPQSNRRDADKGLPYKTVDLSSSVVEEPDDFGDIDA